MSDHFIEPIDPVELSEQFSTEKKLEPVPEIDEEWKENHLDEIKSVLPHLPELEQDFIRLYYFRDKTQVDIGDIYDVTQAAVSYRISRGLRRIEFLIDMPDLGKDEIYDRMIRLNSFNKQDAEIFSEMYESTCQSEVADRLDISQGQVRHRFLSNLRDLGMKCMEKIQSWVNEKQEETKYLELDDMQDDLRDLYEREEDLEDEQFEEEVLDLIDDVRTFVDHADDVELDDRLEDFLSIYETFREIRYNFNILREIELPKWSNRSDRTIA